MHFKYLICVKFQTTCWDAYRTRLNDVEIIEFPALLVNTETGLVESLFHQYVRPVHFPVLSDYCKNVTGLSQPFIDKQKPFKVVYIEFIRWIREITNKFNLILATPLDTNAESGINAILCSWSDWDFGHFLHSDCIRNGINEYDWLKTWIDIRRTYDLCRAKDQSRIRLCDALAHAGIEQKVKNRNGLDNTNDLAKLIKFITSKGVQFKVATSCSF